ncbi:hypothetical protein [Streptomyces sp. NPDC002640]
MKSRHVRAVAVLAVVVLALTGARGSRGGGCDGGSGGSSSHGSGSDDTDHDTDTDTDTDYDYDYDANATGGSGSGSSATSTPTGERTDHDQEVFVTDCVVDEIGLRGTVIVDNRSGEHATYTVTVEFAEDGRVVGKAVDHVIPMNTVGHLKSAVSADYEGPGRVEAERLVDCEVTDHSTRE